MNARLLREEAQHELMETVYLAACDRYDPETIASRVRAAAEALGVSLPDRGSVLLHTAIPWAHPRFSPNSHTHPAIVEGMARALSGASLTIGGQSLPGFPTRYSFKKAGYVDLARRLNAPLLAFDEAEFRDVRPAAGSAYSPALPAGWLDAQFRVSAPRLTGSTSLPFSGALRQLFNLLPQDAQGAEQARQPEIVAALAPVVNANLIVVDGIQALHKGGELSGEPVELGVLIIGTDAVAVDLVCAEAYGVDPAELAPALPPATGGRPRTVGDVKILGDLGLDDLRTRASRVERLDPRPEKYPVPSQITVVRSPRSPLAGASGALTETFAVLASAGISLNSAREMALVVGQVEAIPKGKSDYATIVFLGDSSRGDYEGYSRVIRLTGRTVPVSRALMDIPYAMTIANVRTDLGLDFQIAKFAVQLSRLLRGRRGSKEPSGPSAPPKGGDDQTAQNGR